MLGFFVDLIIKNKKKFSQKELEGVKEEDLKTINSMKRNGPLRKMKAEEIQTRSIIIMGEEPTSKLSIHPEGNINGKKIKSLSQIAKGLPGAPMMVGHRMDKTPWGRTYKANVVKGGPGYYGNVVHENFFFLNDEEGQQIARKIDGGIWAEGSISYWFDYPCCNICHLPMGYYGSFKKRCEHRLGEKDPATGIICMWYPHTITKIAETSYVFAGAYGKTRSMLAADSSDLKQCYSEKEIESGYRLEENLKEYGFDPDTDYSQYELSENGVYQKIENDNNDNSEDNSDNNCGSTSSNSENEKENQNNNGNTKINIDSNNEKKKCKPNDGDEYKDNNPNNGESNENDGAGNQEQSVPSGSGSKGSNQNTGQSSENSQQSRGDNKEENKQSEHLQEKIGNQGNENSQRKGNENGNQGSYQESGSDKGNSNDSSQSHGDMRKPNGESQGQNKEQGQKENSHNSPQHTENGNKENHRGTNEQSRAQSENSGSNDNSGSESQQPIGNNERKSSEETKNSEENQEIDQNSEKCNTFQENCNTFSENATQLNENATPKDPRALEKIEGLSSDDIDEVNSIIYDEELDNEEIEHALREYFADRPDTLLQVLSCEIKPVRPVKIKFCAGCNNEVEELSEIECPSCNSKLVEISEHAAKVFKPIGPVKPKKAGAKNNEFFKKEDFRENLPDGTYYVEPKYDGVWMEMHRKGDEVKIYTDEGNEYSEKFPSIVAEAKNSKANSFIIAGEMTKWRGRKRLTHEDVTAWLHRKQDSYSDNDFKFKPFDIMYVNGKDITISPLSDRRKSLDKNIKWGKQIHPTAFTQVAHKKGEGKIVKAIDDRKSREGTMVKNSDSQYNKRDQAKLFKWKQQFELDCLVNEVKKKEGGGYVYTCNIGRGNNSTTIGDTFATSVEAKKGQIIRVSVDFVRFDPETKKYSWFAPKVLNLRADKKQPDPLSTIKKIAEKKEKAKNSLKNIVTLTEIIPKLKSIDFINSFYLVGGIIEKGLTTNDIDIVVNHELTVEEKEKIYCALGAELYDRVDIIHDKDGPAGPSLEIFTDVAQNAGAWKYSNKFVLQEHGWGKKKHYDIRFGAPKTKRMWGFTLFTEPTTKAGGHKVRAQEKKYHDAKWMDVDTKKIEPGEEGNPTKELNAWMVKKDQGNYKFIRRKPGFLELVLDGKKLKGRYLWREIEVKPGKDDKNKVQGDEVGVKSEKIWIMWKPKNQETNSSVNRIGYKIERGCMIYWETDEVDSSLAE